MPVTAIKSIRNNTDHSIYVVNLENQDDTGGKGHRLQVSRDQTVECNMWIPWADSEDQFRNGSGLFKGPAHILITYVWSSTEGTPMPPLFAIWQQGDHVRYSKDARWSYNGTLVPGLNTVGGDRSVDVNGPLQANADLLFY